MLLDAATLRDLDVVPTTMTRGVTLWSLIDRTRTRLGRESLRQRLVAPPHSAEDIVLLQQAHRKLAVDSVAYRTVLERADLDGVEAYLSVTWQLPADMPNASSVRKWYREYLQDVALGAARVRALFGAAGDLRARFAAADVPILARLGERLASLLETSTLRELQGVVTYQSPPSCAIRAATS